MGVADVPNNGPRRRSGCQGADWARPEVDAVTVPSASFQNVILPRAGYISDLCGHVGAARAPRDGVFATSEKKSKNSKPCEAEDKEPSAMRVPEVPGPDMAMM